ncbi:MAG: hypothetical protein WHS90_12300, partial [Caldilinea sp.]|uniref:hypothetical protein n=1 Tax=Caldilinea sp. TaxID=2293560 RepID=UPI0030B02C93
IRKSQRRRSLLPLSQHWERGPGGEGLLHDSWVRLGCAAESRTYVERGAFASRSGGARCSPSPSIGRGGQGVRARG